ncbi:PDZ domain-containing protein [Dyella sedimenti]|uniref:PDZ domain-containing protein n=1 Tax=Dyella sedimenti TaxID=2919947 RepID=UPI001FAADF6A|nr:PDZ domain-containing protein [Dyella sedimenti]
MSRLSKTLLLALALLLPFAGARADGWFAWISDNTLRWHSGGESLHLSTDKAGGVDVKNLMPAGLWGLAKDDVILEADGRVLHDVAGLMVALRAHGDSPVPLKVRRAGAERSLALPGEARRHLLHEDPPAPPVTPVSPVPPVPLAGG